MRRGQQGTQGLTPQDIDAVVGDHAIGRVRMAVGEFVEREWAPKALHVAFEPSFKPFEIQLITHPIGSIRARDLANSRRAIARLCTSSGPSARRSARIEA